MRGLSSRRAKAGALALAAATAIACLAVPGVASAGIISDFEDGTTDGWSTGSPPEAGITLTPVAGGSGGSNFALRVDRTTGGWNQAMRTVLSASEWADVAAGTTFTIDVKAQGGAGADVPGWWLQVFPTLNSQNGGWENDRAQTDVNLDGQWRTYTWVYDPQPAAPGQWSELFLINQGGAGTAAEGPNMTFYVDNLGIVPIPEPGAACALLAVGGLALAGRRQRRHGR